MPNSGHGHDAKHEGHSQHAEHHEPEPEHRAARRPTGSAAEARRIQILLHRLGLYEYGPNDPDGVIGPRTIAGLNRALGKGWRDDSPKAIMHDLDKKEPVGDRKPDRDGHNKPQTVNEEAAEREHDEETSPLAKQDYPMPVVKSTPHAPVNVKWTRTEIKAIQVELSRLGLFPEGAHGRLNKNMIRGLDALWGSDAWMSCTGSEVLSEAKSKLSFSENKGEQKASDWAKLALTNPLAAPSGAMAMMKILPKEDHGDGMKGRVQSLQDHIDEITVRCRAHKCTEADKAFLIELYNAMADAGSAVAPEAAKLLRNYINKGAEDPMEYSATPYKESENVKAEMLAQQHQIASMMGGGPVTLRSHMLFADTIRLQMCNNRFWLDSKSTQRGKKIRTEFSVTDSYYFENFDRTKVTPFGFGKYKVEIQHGVSKYLIALGIAKEFVYVARWNVDWDPEKLKPMEDPRLIAAHGIGGDDSK